MRTGEPVAPAEGAAVQPLKHRNAQIDLLGAPFPCVTFTASMRRLLPLLAAAALAAGCGSSDDAPAPTRLLGGGKAAFEARLTELKGRPVVVNKWASWCPPCRSEFPFFRRQALKRGREVAFLGIDAQDNDGDAREFLREFPVPFPSYKDPDQEIATSLGAGQAFPATVFYDSKGRKIFVHQGAYASEAKLAEDIERYAR